MRACLAPVSNAGVPVALHHLAVQWAWLVSTRVLSIFPCYASTLSNANKDTMLGAGTGCDALIKARATL